MGIKHVTMFFLIFLFSLKIHASHQSMLIFLDDGEHQGLHQGQNGNESTLTTHLWYEAIEKKISPIVVSGHLLQNLIDAGKEIDENVWVIKKINKFLYLLLNVENQPRDKIERYDPEMLNFTELEYKIGLKINHLEAIEIKKFKHPFKKRKHANYFLHHLSTKRLFLTKADYKNTTAQMPTWAIYLTGHGGYRHSIAHLEFGVFKDLLGFLGQKIDTSVLVIASCYAAGANFAEITEDASKNFLGEVYPFAIITKASVDAPVSGYDRIADFVAYINQAEYVNLIEVAEVLYPTNGGFYYKAKNVVQIRKPNTQWFSFVDQKYVATIGGILAKTRAFDQPLNVETYFNKKERLQHLFLSAKTISFPLIINNTDFQFQSVISLIPGDAEHYIYEIISEKTPAQRVISWFLTLDGSSAKKSFFISNIVAAKAALKDVYILNNDDRRFAYFTINHEHYFWKFHTRFPETPMEPNSPKDQKYKQILAKQQEIEISKTAD